MMIELRQPDALLKKLLPPQKLQPDTVYVSSQFSLTFVHNGHHYIFNTLTKQCVNAELPEQCRTDRIREKCRKCTFLPECTGFASCPIHDADCAKLRRMMIIDSLKRRIDKKETNFDGDIPLC